MPHMSDVCRGHRWRYYEIPVGWREDGSVNAKQLVYYTNYFLWPELYLHPDIYPPTRLVYKCHHDVLDNSS